MHLSLRMTAGTETPKPGTTPMLEEALRKDGARGVAGAEKQHVVRAVIHGSCCRRLDERLHHAGRAHGANRAELLACLYGRVDLAALDGPEALVSEKWSRRLREQHELPDTCGAGTLLELPHDALANAGSATIGSDDDGPQQRGRAKALESSGADQPSSFLGNDEPGARGRKVTRRQPVELEERANAAPVLWISRT